MSVNPTLRQIIDRTIVQGQSAQEFENALTAILEDLFQLVSTYPGDLVHTSAYLAYRASSVHMRSSNFAAQAGYAQSATSAFAYIHNTPPYQTMMTLVPRQIGLRVFTNLYNFHTAFTRNGLLDDASRDLVNTSSPLLALRSFAGATYGPPNTVIRVHSQILPDHRARVLSEDGAHIVDIGSFSRAGAARRITAATWNMQGESGDNESKWSTHVATLAKQNDFVLLQEAGAPPASAERVVDLTVTDQFGVNRVVQQYRWNLGTTARPNWHHIYFYNVGRIRVNLAIVAEENSPFSPRDVVIVSDGPGNPDENEYRPLLGVRIQGRDPVDMAADTTLYSFHAISGGGPNAPRMLREAAWHSDTNYALSGDFNRDPRDPEPGHPARTGNWISPPGFARIDEAAGDTHPGATPPQTAAMLDYAVSNGTVIPPPLGIVTDMQTSDHFAVAFSFDFPS